MKVISKLFIIVTLQSQFVGRIAEKATLEQSLFTGRKSSNILKKVNESYTVR